MPFQKDSEADRIVRSGNLGEMIKEQEEKRKEGK